MGTSDLMISSKEIMPNKISDSMQTSPRIAVLIPCLNEEQRIQKVIHDFQYQIPAARIFVYDNASTDRTAEKAAAAGADVVLESRRGKGYVVQAMFQGIDADIYIMVDGDDTYPADRLHALLEPLQADRADMVIGSRIMPQSKSQFKLLNWLGNKFFLNVINGIFGTRLTDILSGYRIMNRRLVKNLPLFARGFEIEAELTIKSLERGYRLVEVPVDLRSRPHGSFSKIRVVRDGIRILGTILALFRDYKPLTFFGALGALVILLGSLPGLRAILGFLDTGLVEYFPSAILAVGLILSGMLSIVIGLILHTINRRFQELEYFMRLMMDKPVDSGEKEG